MFHSNSLDPDQAPRSVASDLGIQCLSMPLLCPFTIEGISLYHYNVYRIYCVLFKQCVPQSHAAFCDVRSGYTLFVDVLFVSIYHKRDESIITVFYINYCVLFKQCGRIRLYIFKMAVMDAAIFVTSYSPNKMYKNLIIMGLQEYFCYSVSHMLNHSEKQSFPPK